MVLFFLYFFFKKKKKVVTDEFYQNRFNVKAILESLTFFAKSKALQGSIEPRKAKETAPGLDRLRRN